MIYLDEIKSYVLVTVIVDLRPWATKPRQHSSMDQSFCQSILSK